MTTDKSQLRVAACELRAGALHRNIEVPPEVLDLSDAVYRFTAPVLLDLTFTLVHNEVYMKGTACTETQTECVRCLGAARVALKARVDVVYEKNPELLSVEAQALGDADGALAYFDGEQVLFASQIREALLIELPEMPHCSENCKGLCPHCGANLNLAPCHCDNKEVEISPDGNHSQSWKDALRELKLDED